MTPVGFGPGGGGYARSMRDVFGDRQNGDGGADSAGRIERVAVLRLSGTFDLWNADLVAESIREAVDGPADAVVVDFGGTTFVDSTTLGLVLQAGIELEASGRRLLVASPGGPVRRVLAQTRIAGRLHTIEDLAAL
jgi:anti-anti-sigma factor